MHRRIPLIFVGVIVAISVFVLPSEPARAETSVGCQQDFPFEYTTVADPVFQNYESVDYINGYLAIHFKLNRYPFFIFEDWKPRFFYIDDQCRTIERTGYLKFSNPQSVTSLNLSFRFVSTTSWILWDDDNNVRYVCGACQGDIEPLGEFFKVRLRMRVNDGPTIRGDMTSSAHHVVEQPDSPPILTDSASSSAGCLPSTSVGGLVDDYQRAEYVNGLLRLHFRRNPFQDGGGFRAEIHGFTAPCMFVRASFNKTVQFPGYTEYYSIRFTSPTNFVLWNDDLNRAFDGFYCFGACDGSVPSGAMMIALKLQGFTNLGPLDPNRAFTSSVFSIVERPPDPVIIIPGILGSWSKNGELVIDPVLHTYDDLIETLDANGYTPDVDLFTFPYEWRNSNIFSAQALRDKVNAVQTICNCSKVDLVAHSMGGLVARQYIQSSDYGGDVDQLIFLGTPHLGSPKAYLMWEGGEFGKKFKDFLVEFVFKNEAKKAGFNTLFDYVRNRPIVSVQELLPTYNYLKDNESGVMRSYPDSYPSNNFLENLNNALGMLNDSGVRITNIYGELGSVSTTNILRVTSSTELPLWEHGYPDGYNAFFGDHGLELSNGDETVPRLSSTLIQQDKKEFTSEHSQLVSDAKDFIFTKLTGKNPSILSSPKVQPRRSLLAQMLSPADMVIIAPDGRRVGKNFITGQEINEIPGAFYSGFQTDNEYIAIPDPIDGEYILQTQGTGTGEYTIASGFITASTSAEFDFTASTVPGATNELIVTIDADQPDAITVQPSDTTPPSITLISPTTQDYLRSSTLPIASNVTDPSGVAQSFFFFDATPASPFVDLFFKKLGSHTVTVTATDTVNNTSSASVSFGIIATHDSGISDTNRAFALGWIKSKSVKNSIINKFETARDNVRRRSSLLTSLSSYLDTQYTKKTINQQAYDILKEDVLWLQTH